MATTSPERTKWDANLKAKTAQRILNGELSFADAVKELEVQPYQLYAWIGQHSLELTASKPSPAAPADNSDTRVRQLVKDGMASGMAPSSDDQRAIVEWYIRKYIVGAS